MLAAQILCGDWDCRALSWRGAHIIATRQGVFETLLMSHDVIDETGLDPLFLLSPVHRERVRAQNDVIDETGLDPLFFLSPVHRERVRAQNDIIDETSGVL